MAGSMFYWIFWSLWVYLTFILKRQNSSRLKLSAGVLAVIILSPYYIHFAGFALNSSALFLLFLAYVTLYHEKTSRLLYFFICSFIVMIAYVTFHLFEIYDPVWLIFNKEWMLGIVIGFLTILLQKNGHDRLFILIIGFMQGELLYACILRRYHFSYPVGSLGSLDAFSLTLLIIIGWSFFEYAVSFFESNLNAEQKDKQKSS